MGFLHPERLREASLAKSLAGVVAGETRDVSRAARRKRLAARSGLLVLTLDASLVLQQVEAAAVKSLRFHREGAVSGSELHMRAAALPVGICYAKRCVFCHSRKIVVVTTFLCPLRLERNPWGGCVGYLRLTKVLGGEWFSDPSLLNAVPSKVPHR